MGAWLLAVAIGFTPGIGTLPTQACAPPAEDLRPPGGPPAAWALPPICAQEFEGTCTSLDGRVRVGIRYEGKRKVKRVRSGFYGGEGWMQDTFYTGTRTLSVEHIATGKSALFIERLRDSRGFTAPGGNLRYLPEKSLVLVLDVGEDKRPRHSYCIRLP